MMMPPFLHRVAGSGNGSSSSSSASTAPTGGPQRTPLLVPALLDTAARWHGSTPVVSLLSDGSTLVRDWREVRERAAAFASGALRAPSVLGVRPGDRVATLALNSSAHLEVLYASAGVGAIHHTLNPRLFEGDLRWIADDAGDSVVFFDGDFADLAARLRPKLPKVRHWVCLTPDRSGSVPSECEVADDSGDRKKKVRWLSYEKLVERSLRSLSSSRSSSSSSSSSSSASPSSWTPVDENAACGLCYTSGTTGRPKGVLYSHRSNVLHALSAAHGDALDVRAVSTVLMVVPIFHANGWGLSHACPMTGAALILPGRHISGRAIAEAVREFQVSMIAGVPTIFLDFVAAFRSDPRPFPSLESVVIGGAACPPSLAKSLREEVGVAKVNHVYGMTELSPIGTIAGATRQALRLSPEEQHALGAKQGRPSLLVDLRVVDERGRELPRDGRTPGELQARGPHVIHRYANAQRPAVVEGPRSPKGSNSPQSSSLFFPTGDLATIDAMGFMKIVDRTKDVIKSGGEFISSPQLEAEAMGHPFVEEAAAIGVADERWGERPLLFVDVTNAEKATQLTEDEVKGFLKGKVASWWVPEKIVIGVKMIPHGATGKVDKKELRRRFLSGEVGGGKFPQQQQTLCKL